MFDLPDDYFKYDIYEFAYFVTIMHLSTFMVGISIFEVIMIWTVRIDREMQIKIITHMTFYMMILILGVIHRFHKDTLNKVNSGLEVYMRNTRKKKEITTFILCKKVCPDMERLISEYL